MNGTVRFHTESMPRMQSEWKPIIRKVSRLNLNRLTRFIMDSKVKNRKLSDSTAS